MTDVGNWFRKYSARMYVRDNNYTGTACQIMARNIFNSLNRNNAEPRKVNKFCKLATARVSWMLRTLFRNHRRFWNKNNLLVLVAITHVSSKAPRQFRKSK